MTTTRPRRSVRGRQRRAIALLGLPAVLALSLTACGSDNNSTTSAAGTGGADGGSCQEDAPVLTLAAYSNPYDAYGKLTSTFAADYKEKTDKTLIFSMSFGGSTTQATNIVNGFPADVYASSLVPDVELVQDAGLITNDWQSAQDKSIVATSVVGFMVRPDSGIKDWADLVKPGVEILTPDPAQSGGAKWNIVAAYGAVMRGEVAGYDATPDGAEKYLTDLFKNVTVLDKSANDSFKNFESGNGDVALTYENQALAGIAAGSEDKFVIPPSTVSIETPTVVVDKNAEDHCIEDLANQFVKYLHSPDAQEVFQTTGYQRPIDVTKAAKGNGSDYPAIKDLFTTDDIGGWEELASKTVFGPDGAFTKAFKAAQG